MGKRYGYRGDELPVTNDLSSRLLRLPLFYEILEEEQREVVRRVTDFLQSRGS